MSDSSGKVRVEGLPHGTYTWAASLDEEAFTGSIEVAPAKTNQLSVAVGRYTLRGAAGSLCRRCHGCRLLSPIALCHRCSRFPSPGR